MDVMHHGSWASCIRDDSTVVTAEKGGTQEKYSCFLSYSIFFLSESFSPKYKSCNNRKWLGQAFFIIVNDYYDYDHNNNGSCDIIFHHNNNGKFLSFWTTPKFQRNLTNTKTEVEERLGYSYSPDIVHTHATFLARIHHDDGWIQIFPVCLVAWLEHFVYRKLPLLILFSSYHIYSIKSSSFPSLL